MWASRLPGGLLSRRQPRGAVAIPHTARQRPHNRPAFNGDSRWRAAASLHSRAFSVGSAAKPLHCLSLRRCRPLLHRGVSQRPPSISCFRRSFTDIPREMTAMDVLNSKSIVGHAATIDEDTDLYHTALEMIHKVDGGLIVMRNGHVTGIITETDVLKRFVFAAHTTEHSSPGVNSLSGVRVGDIMTPAKKMIFASPEDKAEDCVSIMLSQCIRHLPVLRESMLVGVLSLRDLVQTLHEAVIARRSYEPLSPKAEFLASVLPRHGVPKNTGIYHADPLFPFYLDAAAVAIPRPGKKDQGEDAFFIRSHIRLLSDSSRTSIVPQSNSNAKPRSSPPIEHYHAYSAVGVADGVGSWAVEHGVDAGLFSRAIMDRCLVYIEANLSNPFLLAPQQVLNAACSSVMQLKIVGSSTVCIVTLDGTTLQLRAANLGDSGFLVLRHRSNIVSGTLRQTQTQADNESSTMSVVFRSTQQLKGFNHPFQLGLCEDKKSTFEDPSDADVHAVQVEEGDIILLATDGLFDNLEEAEIMRLVGDGSGEPRQLASTLADAAFKASVDTDKDGPFATLAKDYNILWSGGRKDDISVVVSRVKQSKSTAELSIRETMKP